MALIVGGILNQKLPWGLVLMGVLISITMELVGVSSLPFAVGVYLPIQTSVPIFLGGAVRWIVDRMQRRSDSESDMSPGSLLSTGYIAGGTIAGVVVAFFTFAPDKVNKAINMSQHLGGKWINSQIPATVAFVLLIVVLLIVAGRNTKVERDPNITR